MIRAAVAGLGWWGKTIVRRMSDSDRMRIVSAVELDPSRHAGFAHEHGLALVASLDRVLADPAIDAVILCTPHSLHTGQVLAAAAHGKHVFCEKPLALERADAERSVATCRDAGLVLGIGHERRFEPAMLEVERLVRQGTLGTIMHAEGNFSHDKLAAVPATDWRRSAKDSPAAGMTAMGIHLTDAFVNLFGPAVSAFASTSARVLDSANGDVVSALIRFESGATGYINAILATPLYLRFTVFGSAGWVELRNATHPDTAGPSTLVHQPAEGARVTRTYDWTDSVKANLEAFADAIEGRAEYPFTDAQKVANIALLEAICRSAGSGTAVSIG
ncbi:MAG: Gfo/Idh/MocA family protein [Geminicoccaceae bacterium]